MDDEEQNNQGDPLAGVPDLSGDELAEKQGDQYKQGKVFDEFSDYKHIMAKPRNFWFQASVVSVVQAVAERKITPEKGAELLGLEDGEVWKIKDRAAKYRKHGVTMGFGAKTLKVGDDPNVLVTVPYDQMSKNHIDWARFLDLESPEYFDLRRISAMCYASEKIIHYKPRARMQVPQEFYALQEKARKFVSMWAIYFGKYTLAACLGEFRHRRAAGPVKLVPMGRGKIAREAAQSAAEHLWPNKENSTKAAAYMAECFKDPKYFTGGGFGGGPWSRIAKTLFDWLHGDIPDIVWVDYVWDLSHNAGRFFDKCHLWRNESENQKLLTAKRNSKSGDVREWGKAFLHPEWVAGLDTIEIMDMPAPERG